VSREAVDPEIGHASPFQKEHGSGELGEYRQEQGRGSRGRKTRLSGNKAGGDEDDHQSEANVTDRRGGIWDRPGHIPFSTRLQLKDKKFLFCPELGARPEPA
jgi:hypothetical protein